MAVPEDECEIAKARHFGSETIECRIAQPLELSFSIHWYTITIAYSRLLIAGWICV
jgi:hypothetical protein